MENMEGLNGKVVLVTGGTGFIGSHVVKRLVEKKAKVVVPYRTIHPCSYFATEKLYNRVQLVTGDIIDAERVFGIVTKYEVEYILHIAAQPIVTTAYHNPRETFLTNILGTVNILESSRLYRNIKGIIIASSDKAYGKSNDIYKEESPLAGDHPYEVSKSCADLIANTYYKTYAAPVIITRFGNIYGPGDLNFNRIIPGIMKAMLQKSELELRSDGTYTRDYVYIEDVVSAYIFLLERIEKGKGQAFNISSNDNISVLNLIKKSEKILNKKVRYKIVHSAVNEITNQHLDWLKIKNFGWRSRFNLDKGIVRTYAWYRRYASSLCRI